MAANKCARKLIASSSLYIDPLNADSTVSYKVIARGLTRVYGSVQLADCSRKIEWYFGVHDSIEKVDKAIAMLQEFKTAFLAAEKQRRSRARKSAVKK